MSTDEQFAIKWHDGGREPQCPPDPRYPNGKDIDMADGATKTCTVALAHPAPRCGYYTVECHACGLRIAVTTAGRPDDPRNVTLRCLSSRIGRDGATEK